MSGLVEQGRDGTWGLTPKGARVLNEASTHDGEVAVIDLLHALVVEEQAAQRLEELRVELRAERISYGELAELQGLAEYIDRSDVELLEPAGVPEFPEDEEQDAWVERELDAGVRSGLPITGDES